MEFCFQSFYTGWAKRSFARMKTGHCIMIFSDTFFKNGGEDDFAEINLQSIVGLTPYYKDDNSI
jgi:hypothetical protein